MVKAMETAIEGRNFILGDTFSMADVIFGGTLRYMLRFKMLEPQTIAPGGSYQYNRIAVALESQPVQTRWTAFPA